MTTRTADLLTFSGDALLHHLNTVNDLGEAWTTLKAQKGIEG